MEKVVGTRQNLWMRYVDFSKLVDALCYIREHEGKLRAKDLGFLGIEKGFFRGISGKPFSLTTIYHYRKILEHLQMVTVKERRYFTNDFKGLDILLNKQKDSKELDENEREVLADIIVRNIDCQTYFLNVFSIKSKSFSAAEDFRQNASFIVVETPTHGSMNLTNPLTGASVSLNKNTDMQAIFWGVRLWALGLGLTDEIFTYIEGRRIFPLLHKESMLASDILMTLFKELEFTQSWETYSIPELTKSLASRLRISTKEFHNALRELISKYPQYVDFIPTSTGFISMKASFVRRDPAFLKGYLKDSKGRYISHIRLNKEIVKEIVKGRE